MTELTNHFFFFSLYGQTHNNVLKSLQKCLFDLYKEFDLVNTLFNFADWYAYLAKNLSLKKHNKRTYATYLNTYILWFTFVIRNGILLPKLFWPTVRKKCSSDPEKTFEIRGCRTRICEIFEITRTIHSNSERSEQFLETECFF